MWVKVVDREDEIVWVNEELERALRIEKSFSRWVVLGNNSGGDIEQIGWEYIITVKNREDAIKLAQVLMEINDWYCGG